MQAELPSAHPAVEPVETVARLDQQNRHPPPRAEHTLPTDQGDAQTSTTTLELPAPSDPRADDAAATDAPAPDVLDALDAPGTDDAAQAPASNPPEASAPEETPEEEPTSYEDLACCAVCAEGDWEEDNLIIFCDSCDVAVHQVCYGAGARNIPEGDQPWYCDVCTYAKRTGKSARGGLFQPPCILCPKSGGAMKRTTDGRWAHLTCALWVPGVQFLDPEGRDIIHPYAINEKRIELCCKICNTVHGAPIQCKAPRCMAAFHASCGRDCGWHMVEKEKGDYVSLEALCNKHRPAMTQKKKKRRRDINW